MPAKRAHKKSRNGCGVCRARRVKCDEVKPECGPCRKHEVRCNYDRAAFTPSRSLKKASSSNALTRAPSRKIWSPPVPNFQRSPLDFGAGYPTNRMADLRLMNHYTYLHLSGAQPRESRVKQMWVYDVPQRATQCEFLMQAVLSFAAWHLHIHLPGDGQMRELAHYYFGNALRMFTQSLPNLQNNADAAFAASVLIQFQVFMSWKDPCGHRATYEVPVTWLEMCQGVAGVVRSACGDLRYSCMRPLIENSPDVLAIKAAPLSPSSDGMEEALAEYEQPFRKLVRFLWDYTGHGKAALERTLDLVHAIYRSFHVTVDSVSSVRKQVLFFPITVAPEFVELLREESPAALCILAFYFGIMELVSDIWWFKGRPSHEVWGIRRILPPEFRQYIDWPCQVVEGTLLMEDPAQERCVHELGSVRARSISTSVPSTSTPSVRAPSISAA